MNTPKITVEELTKRFVQASGRKTIPNDWTPAGAWIRVSGDKQDETTQVSEIIKYAIQNKRYIVRWYIVHAKSAFKGEHQRDLDIAIEDMREGQTEVLIIAHSNRLERRENKEGNPDIGTELLSTLAEFADAGGHVESVEEPTLGLLDMGSRALTYMTGLINTEKSKTIRRETKRGINMARENNGVLNKVPPVWYDIVGPEYKKRAVPTKVCREYWPKVLRLCIKGDSAATIAACLDSEGIKTKRGGKWNQGTILHLIHNPIFCGRRLGWEDDAPLLADEAVVPVDIWNKAQEALTIRPKRGPIAETNRPLLAKLTCPRCGSPMYRKQIGGPRSRRYAYRCEGQGPQRHGCGNLVPYEMTELRVVAHVLMGSDSPYQTREWMPGTNWDSEIADTLKKIQALNPVKLGLDEYNRQHAELMIALAEYQRKNEDEATTGGYEYTDVLNDDGSVMIEGQHFFGLDRDGRRDYLKDHVITAERVGGPDDIRVVFDDEEIVPTKFEIALMNVYPRDVTATLLNSPTQRGSDWQALLTGQPIPGATEFIHSYLVHRLTSK